MNLRLFSVALALMAVLSGCTGSVKPPPTPTPKWPNSIGSYREALGPGLVVLGYTALDRVRVEVRVDGKAVQSEEVTSKDGGPGYWSVAWPALQARDAEAVLIDPASGKELVKGAISPEMLVGLFHSSTFADTRVDAKAADRSTLRVSGKVGAGETVRVEFRDARDKVYSTEELKVTKGAFDAALPWPDGAYILHFYTVAGKGATPERGLIINVVAR